MEDFMKDNIREKQKQRKRSIGQEPLEPVESFAIYLHLYGSVMFFTAIIHLPLSSHQSILYYADIRHLHGGVGFLPPIAATNPLVHWPK